MMMMFVKKRQVKALPPLMGHEIQKGNMNLHQRVEKNLKDKQTESPLTEINETMNTLKTLASDTSSKEILDFLNEESQ